jgi:hypothetical protein
MLMNPFVSSRPRSTVIFGCVFVLVLGAASMAHAESISELLEKAIYTEETVGDLDAAIQVYKKVVAGGEDSIKAAAEAQFRIGLCYEKQGKSQQANEAFQRVIERFPTAQQLVAKAKSHLPSEPELLPVPWQDGDELQFEMKLPTGMGIGHQVFRVEKVQQEGQDRWECMAWQTVTVNGQRGKSRVLADFETFAPIEGQWRHSMLGEAQATYHQDKVGIQLINRDEPVTLDIEGPVYDNEQAAELFRRLPLKIGYKTQLNIISSLSASKIPLGLNVTKIETIEVPAGQFECFRLTLDIGQTFWVSTDENRFLVRFQVGGVTADLISIRKSGAGQTMTLNNERYSLTLPADWYSYQPSGTNEKGNTTTILIDPDAVISSRIEAGPLDDIKQKQDSPRAWLESSLNEYRKRLQDFSVVGDIQATSIDNRDAADVVFEFQEGDQMMKGRRVTVFGENSAVNLRFTSAADRFDPWQPAVEKIKANLQVK